MLSKIKKYIKTAIYDPINERQLQLESNGGVPVNIQDQTTQSFAFKCYQVVDDTLSLASSPTVGAYTITLSPGHGLVGGETIAVLEENSYFDIYWGNVLSVAGDVATIDTQVPFAFSTSATVFTYITNMNVNGSVTPQVFGLTNPFSISVDITRLIWYTIDGAAMDASTFSGITALTRGIAFRRKLSASQYINLWNIKTNGDWSGLAFDVSYDDRRAPTSVYGFSSRMTYAGQDKHGVVIRIAPGESIELVVQDDLTAITNAVMTIEGHFVQDL